MKQSSIHYCVCSAVSVLLVCAGYVSAGPPDEITDAAVVCGVVDPGNDIGCLASGASKPDLNIPELELEDELPLDPNDPALWAPVTFGGTCNGGDNDGQSCIHDEDCPNGTCDNVQQTEDPRICVGGAVPGDPCTFHSDCPGGTCEVHICEGGINDGNACTSDADCLDGTCVVWDEAYDLDDNVFLTEDDFPFGCFAEPCASRQVFAPDTRVRIRGTRVFPWSAVGRLDMRFPNGSTAFCSGAMISRRHVLTAAHCIYSAARGGWANRIRFSPGQRGPFRPFGRQLADQMIAFRGYVRRNIRGHDMAVVRLRCTSGCVGWRTGWFGMSAGGVLDTGSIRNLSGYPTDKARGTQWFDWNRIFFTDPYQLHYFIDTFRGQSGGPVWRYRPSTGQRHIRAVHRCCRSGLDNQGTRLTRGKFRAIIRFLRASGARGGGDECVDCGPDCNENGVGDAEDIMVGTSDDVNGNGIPDGCEGACCFNNGTCDATHSGLTCLDAGGIFRGAGIGCTGDGNGNGLDDGCEPCIVPEPPTLAGPPHDILKNRYISIDPRGASGNNPDAHQIRVMVDSSEVNGQAGDGPWWAAQPNAACISLVTTTKPEVEPDWSLCNPAHLTGCPIVPTTTYVLAAESAGLLSADALFDTQAKPGVKWHGDCVGFFDGMKWTPPNGTTSIDDAVAGIKTFQDPNALNATHVSVTDVVPNLNGMQINKIVNINDVFSIILGFQGQEYPGPDLTQCP